MNTSVRRSGNIGVMETRHGFMSFEVGQSFTGFSGSSSFSFSAPKRWGETYVRIGDYDIIPMGENNAIPQEIRDILDEAYHGEGILGKIQGLQWGEGPRLYEEVEAEDGTLTRKWRVDKDVMDWLDSFNGMEQMMRCHVDFTHGLGYFIKVYRNRGPRVGRPAQVSRIEHVMVKNARYEYPGDNVDYPKRIVVGTFPNPDIRYMAAYNIWDHTDPFANNVSMKYQSLYSFCKDFYSTPRYFGALNWMKLSNSIAPLLANYNTNASAVSFHIESPQEYWDALSERIKKDCELKGIAYKDKMLEDAKDAAFAKFSEVMSGVENVGKFLHTQSFYSDEGREFTGWKVTPIDKKIKDYVEAQIKIADKGESAATSGFGLPPSLSNIIIDGKLNSGSELLYALKGYFATETFIPEMILFEPWNRALKINFPDKNLKFGFYRTIIQTESNVTSSNRMKNSI